MPGRVQPCRVQAAPGGVRTFPVDRAAWRALRETSALSRFQPPGAKRRHTQTYWIVATRLWVDR